jgi:uncharacterized protein (TIGR02246 family)
MRMLSGFTTLVMCALMFASYTASAQSVDVAADEAAIRALDVDWVDAVAAKDAAATAAFYAMDGAIMPAGSPMAEGPDAIAAVWQSLFDLPGFSLTFEPTFVEVGASGDVAYDIGTYALAFDGDQGPVQDNGKYVVVWKKVDGVWKVRADIFNSNGAM